VPHPAGVRHLRPCCPSGGGRSPPSSPAPGLRFGEAVALTVADVDLLAETPIVRVTKSWRRTDGGFEVGPTKSRKSRRTGQPVR
jgi:integrase